MKKLIAGLLLTTSLSSFAGSFLQEADCTATYDNGVTIKVGIHLDEDYYCSEEGDEKEYKGIVVIDSPISGQEVHMGAISTSDGANGEAFTTVSYQLVFPEEGTASFNTTVDYFSGNGTYSMKFTTDEGEEEETVPLKCNVIQYQIDCEGNF